jgi:voltage-gated sodium channel
MAVGLFGEQDPIRFGKLSRSVFTMFQVCTGDGWASDVTRSLFYEDGEVSPVPAIFFVSYMLVCYVDL